jgi:D-beta-D-heptose 7-phosphate kinase/D-beta-D-heptose 1-phosphate adenosyltransferase
VTRQGATAAKVKNLAELLHALGPERERGKTIAFTNGCFDLLHVGHARLLERASHEADFLIVGVNGDESVRRLKGSPRPYVPFEERAELLAGLEAVDFVVRFDEDTPAEIIAALRPDVLVKGGDWSLDRIVGRETVEAAGGRVLSLPLVPGRSTTSIVDKIRAEGADGSLP